GFCRWLLAWRLHHVLPLEAGDVKDDPMVLMVVDDTPRGRRHLFGCTPPSNAQTHHRLFPAGGFPHVHYRSNPGRAKGAWSYESNALECVWLLKPGSLSISAVSAGLRSEDMQP